MDHNTFSCFVVFDLKNLGDAQNVKKLKTETWSALMNVTNGFTGMFFNTNRWPFIAIAFLKAT